MGFQQRYKRARPALLADQTICEANRLVFKEFFDFEEYKLRRQNGLAVLDEPSYNTLYGYIVMLRNVNTWFSNKPWKDLSRDEIKQVYDGLEDATITNQYGLPVKNRHAYYNKIFKSKPFRIAGKSELARDIIEFSTKADADVHFVTEETFRKMVSVLSKPHHLLLFWLAWDIGENIGALLKLTKDDFMRQICKTTDEAEYLVRLPRRKIKRSRQARTEPTHFSETVRYADMVLRGLQPGDRVFGFGHRQALKLMHIVVQRTGVTRVPDKERPTWRDLRSGMACHLMTSGCSLEEVRARLGHRPGSTAIDRYINFLAIDRGKAKQKVQQSFLDSKQAEVQTAQLRVKLLDDELKRAASHNEELTRTVRQHCRALVELKKTVDAILEQLSALPMPTTVPAGLNDSVDSL